MAADFFVAVARFLSYGLGLVVCTKERLLIGAWSEKSKEMRSLDYVRKVVNLVRFDG